MNTDEIHAWHGTLSNDSLPPPRLYSIRRSEKKGATALDPDLDLNAPLDRAIAMNYQLAGRSDSSHSFKDLRSAAKARKRHRERNERYYSWRYVKPGDLGRRQYRPNHHAGVFYSTLLPEAPIETMTKDQLYRDAQAYPRPPKLHRSKPWGKAPWGTAYRYSGSKHARQRFAEDVNEARGAEGMFLTTRGDSHIFPTEKFFIRLYDSYAEGTLGEGDCGCGCCLCHRKCHEQQRREREDAEIANPSTEDGDDGWDLPSETSSDGDSDGKWDFAESNSESKEEWILKGRAFNSGPPCHDRQQPATASSFTGREDFDFEGYLPYTQAHLLSDLVTRRCRACVAQYLTRARLESYNQAG